MLRIVALLAVLAGCALGEVYFKESFGSDYESRWVASAHKGSDAGQFKLSAGKYFADAEDDKGIQTSEDAKFYGLSASFPTFSNADKKLIVSFTVKHEQNIDCGGGYVKLFPSGLDQADMHGDSAYNLMFGPDICGPGTRKVHVIFAYKGKNLLTKKTISCKTDEATHLYTLIVNPDNTYEVQIDGEKEASGSLFEDFDFLPPKMIKDPAVSKPADWVDVKKIADPEDTKPADFDQPQHIADPEAEKPDDWDDEMDGEWEPPQIENPEYKGEWKAKEIDNPEYKGEWEHPEIENPEYFTDDFVYKYADFGVIGFDLWQVKAGTIFDNVLITDDVAELETANEAFKTRKTGEDAMKEAAEAKEKAEKEAEEAAKAAEEKDGDEGDEVKDEPATTGHEEL